MAKSLKDMGIESPDTNTETVDNPLVAVSRQSFAFEADASLFGVPPRRIKRPDGSVETVASPPITFWTHIGVTFLCASVPVFSLLDHPLGQQPPRSLSGPRRVVEMPLSQPALLQHPPFVGPDLKRDVDRTQATFADALRAKGWGSGAAFDVLEVERSRFAKAPGDVEPDIIVLPVREIFGVSEESRQAHDILMRLIRVAKRQDHVGALHDFAVLHGGHGSAIAQECRRRARQCEWKAIGRA